MRYVCGTSSVVLDKSTSVLQHTNVVCRILVVGHAAQIRASTNELDEADFNSSKSFKLVDIIPSVATDDERTAND